MRFLRRFRRAAGATVPVWRDLPGLAPAVLAPDADGTNPIHRLLDDIGLPWREPRREVEARVGISADPLYGREALFFPDAARPPGFLQPWQAAVFERYAPDMPIVRFSGLAWSADDADANADRLAGYFADRLGPAPIGQEYHTLACRWRCGTASLQLLSWPPAWQSPELRNDAYERDPRLATACHATLLTGFRLLLSAEEERWVADFRPIAPTRPAGTSVTNRLCDTAPGDTEVEYARDPAAYLPAVLDQVGCPPNREALIICTNQLFILPARDVLGFEVVRLLPAKGGGGSSLSVRCNTNCPDIPHKTLHIAHDGDPDGITPLGQELAAMFGTSCEISPYYDDV